MAASMDPGSAIERKATKCCRLFETTEQNKQNLRNPQAFNHQERFVLWAQSSGALQQGSVSLDQRLRGHERISQHVLDLLLIIENCLTMGGEPQEAGSTEITSTNDTMPPHMTTLEDDKEHTPRIKRDWVGESITVLIRLNTIIRRASAPNSRYSLPSNRPWLDQTFEPYFEDLARIFVRRCSSFVKDHQLVQEHSVMKPSLVNQLSDSLARRRKKLLYQWQHERKIRNGKLAPVSRARNASTMGSTYQAQSGDDDGVAPVIEQRDYGSGQMQSTKASVPRPSRLTNSALHRQEAGTSPVRSIALGKSTKPGLDIAKLYPDSPVLSENAKLCLCSFCSKMFEVDSKIEEATARQEEIARQWILHVRHEHAEPYICLSEHCRDPPRFFASKTSWREHMKSVHSADWTRRVHGTKWCCTDFSGKYGCIALSDVEEFKRHRMKDHKESPDAVQLILLKKLMCVQEIRDELVCPLCEARPSEVKDFLGLEEHIASELEYLAFASFPNVNGRDALPKKNGKDATAEISIPLEGESEDSSGEHDRKPGPRSESSQESLLIFSDDVEQEPDSGTVLDQYNQIWQDIKALPRTIVPSITVDSTSDHRGESTEQHNWGTTDDNFSNPDHSENEEPLGLEQQLWREAVQHANKGTPSFWPPSVWKSIVTKEAIANEILEYFPDYDQGQAENIAQRVWQDQSGKCVQLFTILVLLDKVELLVEHILDCKEGVRDHDLPLVLNNQHHRARSSKLCRQNFEPVCCFSRWRIATLEQFEGFQRRLTVPIFRLDTRNNSLIHLELDDKDILPWCEEAEVPPVSAMSGGSGTVIRVKIHPKCHEFHDTLRAINVADGSFAVKRLRHKTFVKFKNEVNALKRFNGKIHPHLVTLLATFTQGEYYHMIFPWAEYDLDQYWENHPEPYPGDVNLVRWLSQQCLGIMEAVSVIHSPSHLTSDKKFGRHGDIKAENILWFKSRPDDTTDRGILVLSDLGLTAINSERSRSLQPNTGLKLTPSYRPPECDIKNGTISRSFDIWTLGCLYLELVCWLLRGHAGKVQFDEARTTPFIFGTRADIYFDIQERKNIAPGMFVFKVKDIVSKTLSELHDDPHCSQWVHELLDLIENDMLVVQSKTHGRKTSQALLEKLRDMDNKVQSNTRYSTSPVPQNRTHFWKPQVGTIAELNEAAQRGVADYGVGTHEAVDWPVQQAEDLSRVGY